MLKPLCAALKPRKNEGNITTHFIKMVWLSKCPRSILIPGINRIFELDHTSLYYIKFITYRLQ